MDQHNDNLVEKAKAMREGKRKKTELIQKRNPFTTSHQ